MKPAWGVLALLSGCTSILGIGEPSGAAGVDAAAPDAAEVTDFTFGIVPLNVTVPYEGLNLVPVQIDRLGGFDGPVTVTVKTPVPPGLVTQPLTIPTGADSGELRVGANGNLLIGMSFTLELVASASDVEREDSVPAEVTGAPGTLDVSWGSPDLLGVAHQQPGNDGGPLRQFLVLPDGSLAGNGFRSGLAVKATRTGWDANGVNPTVSGFNFCGCSQTEDDGGFARQSDAHIVYAINSAPTGNIKLQAFDGAGVQFQFFGSNSIMDLDLGGTDTSIALRVFADNSLALYGLRDGVPVVAKIFADGTLDPSFDANGLLDVPLGAFAGHASFAVDNASGGRIWVVGGTGGPESATLVRRYALDGTLDTGWGGTGEVTAGPLPAFAEVGQAITFDSAGRVYVAVNLSGSLAVRRFTADGMVDTSFGQNGFAATGDTGLGTGGVALYDIAVQLDGRVVVLGQIGGTSWLARFREDGGIDTTMSATGIRAIDIAINPHGVQAMRLTADGKALVGGVYGGFPEHSFIARLWL